MGAVVAGQAIKSTNVLLVDDDHDDFLLTRDTLGSIGTVTYRLKWVDTFDKAREELRTNSYDVALVDYRIGEQTGLDFIRQAVADHPTVPMILLTGLGSVDIDIAAQKVGAADYLLKDGLNPELLDRSIRYACEQAERTALLNSALTNAAAGMVALDRAGKPVIWNRSVLAALSIDTQEPTLEAAEAIQATIDAIRPDASVAKEITTRSGLTFETRLSRIPGGGSMIVFHDVTQRKKVEQLLLKAAEEAEAAARTKARFLANISHELRTPLTGILGIVHLLESTFIDDEQRGYLGTIRNSGLDLLAIINDVLDLSKVEAGQMRVDTKKFRLADVVDDVVRLLAPTAFAKGLEITAFVDPNLPRELASDPHRLKQVLSNLIGNAIKFTATGAIAVRVASDRVDGRAWARFDVVDEGIGIPPDRAHLLFQRFSQVDASTTRKFGGTGLGLVLCREIVDLLGGRIWFDSTPGAGSTFSFTLPLQDLDQDVRPVAGPTGRPDSPRVLLVSPVEGLHGVVSDYVRAIGGRTTIAVDLASAVAALDALADPLILVDANLASATLADIERACASRGRFGPERVVVIERYGHSSQSGKAALKRPFVNASFDAVRRKMAIAEDREKAANVERPRQLRNGLKVLVAEDNPTNQKLMAALLASFGHDCTLTSNGLEALEVCAEERFDVIIMDVNMPVMDGIEATTRLRSAEPTRSLPIIGLTATTYHEDVARCRSAGMTDVLSKPVDWEHLRVVLASMANRPARSMKVAS